MVMFLIRRLVAMVGVLLALTVALFALQQMSGVDPAKAYVGTNASQAAVDAARERLGLDEPLVSRYLTYLGGVLHGNLQNSLRSRTPVADALSAVLPASLELAVWVLGLAIVLGAGFAMLTALDWRGAGVIRVVLLSGAAAPTFLLGMVSLLLFYGQLGWLPSGGRTSIRNAPDGPTGFLVLDGLLTGRPDVTTDALQHLAMPALCAAIGPAVAIGRVLVDGLKANLAADHSRTARSTGMGELRILLHHAVRNSLGPTLSMVGLQAGLLLAGLVVVEKIFDWPGVGSYLDKAVAASDFPAIAGVALVLGMAYVLVNTVVDCLQALADRRIALS